MTSSLRSLLLAFLQSKWRRLSKIKGIFLPDWTKEVLEGSLVEAVTMYEKQEKRKTRFTVENDLQNILQQSKWVVNVFQGINTTVLCFAFKKLNERNVSEIDLFEKFYSSPSLEMIVDTN